jgi:Flp pilus assembly protein TadB
MSRYNASIPKQRGNEMPLSEHEQRLLEEMERSLYHNDADFVATVGARRGRPAYRSIVLGILLAVVGIAVLVTGVLVQAAIVGILGFVLMFAGVLVAIAPPKQQAASLDDVSHKPNTQPRGTSQQGFMDKLNDRWDKRQDGHN